MKTVRPPRFLAIPLALAVAVAAVAQSPLTLEEALRQARSANARLPLPALDMALAREKQTEARASRWLKVALEGNLVYAPPHGYDVILTNLGEERLQVVGRQPIYAGGAIKAASARADSAADAAAARFQVAERDLDLEVRSRFTELVEARSEAEARREGIERLKTYRISLQSRRAAGQGVAADLLKTDVRLASEEVGVADAERRQDEARLVLNDLMGRDPAAPLELAPLAAPEPPAAPGGDPWKNGPELAAAEADARTAGADVTIAQAERKPTLFLNADFGLWGSDTTHAVPGDVRLLYGPNASFGDRLRRDAGYSFSLVFAWPVWDHGAARSRILQAELGRKQAELKLELQRRQSRLLWEQATAALGNLYRQIEILSRASPDARDSYLEAESRYRGGAATSLEVLDAYASSIEAAVRLAEAIARYRLARAVQIRWGGP